MHHGKKVETHAEVDKWVRERDEDVFSTKLILLLSYGGAMTTNEDGWFVDVMCESTDWVLIGRKSKKVV